MRRLITVFLTYSLLAGQTRPVLEFAATGNERAHEEFILGIIALHGSAYDVAAGHFRAAEKIDPNFVMAYWGEAMSFNHPFWNQQDIGGARRALAKLAPTRAARATKAATPREKAYLSAIETLYDDGDRDSRDFAFAESMKRIAMDYPQDYEAAAFYVLALLSTRRVGDATYPQKQESAAAILNAILEKYPEHPGALHYLMHTDDDPEHAAQALQIARKYERIAGTGASPHAMHMPSHIYAQLGLWPDVVRSNQTAFDASAKKDFHSLEYLQYAQLQMGQYSKAREVLSVMLQAAKLSGLPGMNEEAAVMASRFAVETGDWDSLSSVPATTQIPEVLFARGLASLDKNDGAGASRFASMLETLIQSDLAAQRRVRASTTRVLQRLLEARSALNAGRSADAERLASEAVDLEAQNEIPAEINGIVKPAAEFFGEVLLSSKKANQAAIQFEGSLKQRPKRAMSMLGLARSLTMLNDSRAGQSYRELAEMWTDADPSLKAVQEVRSFVRNQ